MCALSLLAHEAAHIGMALALGLQVKRIGVSFRGPYIVREQGAPFTNAAVALAGPLTNLLLALFYGDLSPQFGLVNLILGGFNLLPVPHSDGRRAWAAIREGRSLLSE